MPICSPISRLIRVVVVTVSALCSLTGAESPRATVSWNQVLGQADAWYRSAEALRIAENVLLYQHPNGGWPKNIDMARPLSETEMASLTVERTHFQTLIDNGATYTQMRFLARVFAATGTGRFKEGFERGLDFLLRAQYENGGWPMFYPIREGYYEHITFNDNAMIGVMRLLRDIAREQAPYTFVDIERRKRATIAIQKGVDVILKSQVRVGGKLTVWCAQHDRTTLEPAKARAYELPSLSGSESVGIVRYLMDIENPNQEVIQSIEGAVAWFQGAKLAGIRVEKKPDVSLPKGYDLVVVADPAAATPLWARFYEIGPNRPMFVGRDAVVRYALAEIEHERRVGYAWLGSWPLDLLQKDYPAWVKRVALDKNKLDSGSKPKERTPRP